MTLTTLIIQILLTLPLTFIINTLSKKDNNTIHRIIVPTVYTIILAALIPSIKENIFLTVALNQTELRSHMEVRAFYRLAQVIAYVKTTPIKLGHPYPWCAWRESNSRPIA